MLKLVPFNPAWITHDKLDLKAIYRRPRFVEDEYGEMVPEMDPATGQQAWDITTPLSVKHHSKHTAKGFEYVTLADLDSLVHAHRHGTLPEAPKSYSQDPRTGGPWNLKKYLEGQQAERVDAAARMEADVRLFGSEAYERIKGVSLPAHLRGIPPASAVAQQPAEAQAVAEGDVVVRRGRKPRVEPASV